MNLSLTVSTNPAVIKMYSSCGNQQFTNKIFWTEPFLSFLPNRLVKNDQGLQQFHSSFLLDVQHQVEIVENKPGLHAVP